MTTRSPGAIDPDRQRSLSALNILKRRPEIDVPPMPGLTSLGSKGPMTPKTVNYKRERAKLAHSSAQLEASAAEWSLSERFKSASHMSLPRLRTKFTAVKSTSTIDLIGDLAEHYVQRPDPVFSKPGDFVSHSYVE